MDEKRLVIQLQRLTSITNEEWIVTSKKCYNFLQYRLKGKTGWGVHSETNLGISVFDYYFVAAVEKLYEGAWTWQFEKFNIIEQIITIMNSMISANVDKATNIYKRTIVIEYDSDKVYTCKEIDIDDVNEEEYDVKIQLIKNAIQNDSEMKTYFSLVQEGYSSKEISQQMGVPISKVYKFTEKLKAVTLKKLNYAK